MEFTRFDIITLKEAEDFLRKVQKSDIKAFNKIMFNIRMARSSLNTDVFKKLDDDVWEFRTLYNQTHYRLLAFWDKSNNRNTLVIATHGIIKKTSRVPLKEIEKTKNLKKIYFEAKYEK